jgi:hypothetical protein
MVTGWECPRCHTPVDGARFDPWCETCQDKTLAVEVTETPERRPDALTRGQYNEICRAFTGMGIVNRTERMKYLTMYAGRPVGDYWELSATEAAAAAAALKERARART